MGILNEEIKSDSRLAQSILVSLDGFVFANKLIINYDGNK